MLIIEGEFIVVSILLGGGKFMNELRDLRVVAKQSYIHSKIPITVCLDTGESIYETNEEDMENTYDQDEINSSYIDKKELKKNEKGKIRIWNDEEHRIFASFYTIIDNKKVNVTMGPEELFASDEHRHNELSDVVVEMRIKILKSWIAFLYNLSNPTTNHIFLDETTVSTQSEDKIAKKKTDLILSGSENKSLIITYIIKFLTQSDVQNMLKFVDKYYNSLRFELSEDPIQKIKYNVVVLITRISNELLKTSLIDNLTIYSMGEMFISGIDKMENDDEIFQSLKACLLKYVDVIKDKKVYSSHVQQILQIINRNIYDDISVLEICNTLYLDPSYLSTLFKKEFGISMKEHIQNKRIEETQLLLKYTDVTISEIAKLLNFCTVGYFTKVFKKHVGSTPKEYRIKNKVVM